MATLAEADGITELCRVYREARAAIERFSDGTEREIARASLRLEATRAYRQMSTTGTGDAPADLKVLADYIANLEGGERIERQVQAFDARAEQALTAVLSSVVKSIAQGTLVGVLAIVFGVAAVIFAAGLEAGEALAFAVTFGTISGGVAVYALRGGAVAVKAVGQAVADIWASASSVGAATDAALSKVRSVEQRVVSQVTGAPWLPPRFTSAARTRAMVLAGATLVLLAAAALLFAAAVATGFSNADTTLIPSPTYESP